MEVSCEACNASFTNVTDLQIHNRSFHKIPSRMYECDQCSFKASPLNKLARHFRTVHNKVLNCHCRYCLRAFSSRVQLSEHMETIHRMPALLEKPKPIPTLQPSQSAFKNKLQVFEIDPEGAIDLNQLLQEKAEHVKEIIGEQIKSNNLKVQLCAEVEFVKPLPTENESSIRVFFISYQTPVFGNGVSDAQYSSMAEKVLKSLENFVTEGSGWIIKKIHKVILYSCAFKPLAAGSYIATPPKFDRKQCLLNIRTYRRHDCFKLCWTAARHLRPGAPSLVPKSNVYRWKTSPTSYDGTQAPVEKPSEDFQDPMPLDDIPRFEEYHETNVNVLHYKEEKLEPVFVSKRKFDFTMDLLLLTDENCHHFVLITNLASLIRYNQSKTPTTGEKVCRNCFHISSNAENLQNHEVLCRENQPAHVKMPNPENASLKFKKKAAQWFTPFIVYWDTESLLKPVQCAANDPCTSSSRPVEHHVPISYAFTVVQRSKTSKVINFKISEKNEDCMKQFLTDIVRLAKQLYYAKRKFPTCRESPPPKESATHCWICRKEFLENDGKDLDHCHVTGDFLGWAHVHCNRGRKTIDFTPVAAHHSSGYDLHHFITALADEESNYDIEIIPNTDETYICLALRVEVSKYLNAEGHEVKSYETLKFIDSHRFMNSSLEKLASFLPTKDLVFIDEKFKHVSAEKRKLLYSKGFYPYSYMNSVSKFDEPELPPLDQWKNSLDGGQVTVSEQEFNHALRVFKEFNCQTIGDYHNLYLTVDVFLLTCIFEAFRTVCFNVYGLDCAYYLSASNLAGDAFLKICCPDLELLTEREHLDLAEDLIKGGIASVFEERLTVANNELLPNWDPAKPPVFIFVSDATNLYGGGMQQCALPVNGFTSLTEIEQSTVQNILSADPNGPMGWILVVDLIVPDKLHDKFRDFPLAPTKQNVQFEWLSDFQLSMREQAGNPNCKKLLQTLYNKERYTIHFALLQFYISQGLELGTVHQILQFNQSPWLKPYIDLNTECRKNSRNKFEENFFKLMNNAAYGKTLESKRKRKSVEIIRTGDQVLTASQKVTLKGFKIVQENLAIATFCNNYIVWNKPTIVGAAILELSKLHMFRFHYEVMRENFECRLLYSDTDSLFYKIVSRNFYQDLQGKPHLLDHFDFSNFPTNHPLYSTQNKLTPLKFKDEMGGKVVEEFCGMRSKMYSLKIGDSQKKSAKGVTLAAQKSLYHDLYKNVLLTGDVVRLDNTRIGSIGHQLWTTTTRKVSLSSYDDKRFIKDNNISTLPFGHKDIRNAELDRLWLNESDDWGFSQSLTNDSTQAIAAPRSAKAPTGTTLPPETAPSSVRDNQLESVSITANEHRKSSRNLFEAENAPTESGDSNVSLESTSPSILTTAQAGALNQITEPVTLQNLFAIEIYTPPDQGMNQSPVDENTLEVVDFEAVVAEPTRRSNPFVNDEAEVVLISDSDAEDVPVQPRKKRKNRKAFIPSDSD